MKKLKQIAVVLVAAVMSLAGLTACGGNKEDEARKEQARVRLTFLTPLNLINEETMQQTVYDFNEAYEGKIHVTLVDDAGGTALTQLGTQDSSRRRSIPNILLRLMISLRAPRRFRRTICGRMPSSVSAMTAAARRRPARRAETPRSMRFPPRTIPSSSIITSIGSRMRGSISFPSRRVNCPTATCRTDTMSIPTRTNPQGRIGSKRATCTAFSTIRSR